MEETKYYTPAPDDIRPGLVYEYRRWPEEESCEWDKRVLPENGSIIQNILERLKRDTQSVRVPYLTAEQIESEGWERTSDQRDYSFGDRDEEHYTMHHSVAFNEVVINRHSYNEETSSMRKQLVYFGKCRCINDLRLICKLLGI